MNYIRIIRLPDVIAQTGLQKTSIYNKMKAGSFPKSICLSERAIGWTEKSIQDWLQQRIEESQKTEEAS